MAYDGFRDCFYIFMNHRYGSKKVLVLTVVFGFVSKNSHTFHHYKQISLKWFDAHHHKSFLNVQKRKKFLAKLVFSCTENLFEVVCITHNGLHKVKLVMILIFLVFVKKTWTRLGWAHGDKTGQRGKLLYSEKNLISMVERVWVFKDKYENNRKD